MEEPMRVPDAIEPMIGYRAFDVYEDEPDKLRSITLNGHAWAPGVNVADCLATDVRTKEDNTGVEIVAISVRKRRHSGHESPAEACGCGLYSMKQLEDVAGRWSGSVFAEIASWGIVRSGPKGQRAQFACVRKLIISGDGDDFQALADRYGVPMVVREPLEARTMMRRGGLQDRVFNGGWVNNGGVIVSMSATSYPTGTSHQTVTVSWKASSGWTSGWTSKP